ncbi:hypothetical protein [Streptomyces griseorubiginosus]|uniref:hypothetical protein n=1 Tax=Streptomyces griseorubiginosus TaxID=67304 RepID=UPI0036E0DA42
MSKHGPCQLSRCTNPAIAWWKSGNGAYTSLCQACLDYWFDNADDDDSFEPVAWGWFAPPTPPASAIAAWAADPRNHREVAAVLRREARVDPQWLRQFLAREQRAGRLVLG